VARDRKPLRERARNMFRNQFTCACCPGKVFRGHRALNAHHLARHGGYWAGQKARGTGRKIGRQADLMRRVARGWQESHGLLDHRGRNTAKMRSRPDRPVRRIRDLRDRDRHGRDADRTDKLASRLERRATRSGARADRHASRAARHKLAGRKTQARAADARATRLRDRATASRGRVADTRMGHHQRWPERPRQPQRTRT
jgi:hypothetical protein